MAKTVGRHSIAGISCALHHRRCVNGTAIDHSRRTNHAFAPDRRHFHHGAIFKDGEHRTKAASWKVHVLNALAWFVKDVLEFERHDGKQWKKTSVVGAGERGQ